MRRPILKIVCMLLVLMLIAACGSQGSGGAGSTGNTASQGSSQSSSQGASQGTSQSSSQGAGTDAAPKFEKMSLKFGHPATADQPIQTAAEQFAKNVSERTGGAVTIEIFPAEQIGTEKDMVEQTKAGAIHFVWGAPGTLGAYVPQIEILTGPFLFADWDEAKKVMQSDVAQEIYKKLEDEHNLKVLDAAWYLGWRYVTANKRITSPDDMKGLKMRAPAIPLYVETFKALGANPTPLPLGEVYTALQTGVVDAQENPIPLIYGQKFYEVQKYVIGTRHMLQSNIVTTNAQWFNGLPAELQQIIKEEIVKAGELMTELQMKAEQENVDLIKAAGVEFVEVDRGPFREKTAVVYEIFQDVWGKDLYQRILDVIKN